MFGNTKAGVELDMRT